MTTPAHRGPRGRKPIVSWAQRAPVTALIIALCTGAWVVTAVQSRSLVNTFYDSDLAFSWTLWGPLVGGEWPNQLRPLLAMFMHLDAGHLAVNMVMLAFIGHEIERYFGSGLFSAAYLAGGLGSAATVMVMNYDTPTVGASGALFALMVLLVGVHRRRGLGMRAPVMLVAANVVYTFIADNVSLWGHLGGLLAGLVLLGALFARSTAIRWVVVVSVIAVSVVVIAFRAGLWG